MPREKISMYRPDKGAIIPKTTFQKDKKPKVYVVDIGQHMTFMGSKKLI